MDIEEIIGQLEAAHACVARAVNELLLTDMAATNCCEHLERASSLLLNIQQSKSLRTSDVRLGPALRGVAVQAETATRLLESAATSYLGRLLSNQILDAGYTPEGATEKLFSGLSLVMEG